MNKKIPQTAHSAICSEFKRRQDEHPNLSDSYIAAMVGEKYGVKSGSITKIVFRYHPEWKRQFDKQSYEKQIRQEIRDSAVLHQFSPAWVGRTV